MKSKFSLSLLVFLAFFFEVTLSANTFKFTEGQFCQFNSECTTGCCAKQKCQAFNSCPILQQIDRYENKNYCTLDSQCDSGLCCFDQKCLPQMNCFIWIYFPIIGAAVVAVIFSQIAGLWI